MGKLIGQQRGSGRADFSALQVTRGPSLSGPREKTSVKREESLEVGRPLVAYELGVVEEQKGGSVRGQGEGRE